LCISGTVGQISSKFDRGTHLRTPQLLPDVVPGARLLRRPAELPRQVENVGHQRAAAHFKLSYLGVLAVFGTQHPQPLAVGPVAGIVKIAEHVVPLDPGLEDGPERRLRLVLVETLLHVLDRRLGVNLVSARNAVHGGHLRILVVVEVGVGVYGGALGALDDGVELAVAAVQFLQDLLHFDLLLPDLVQCLDVGVLGRAGAQRPLLDALRQHLQDPVRGQLQAALVGAVLGAVARAVGARGAVALAGVVRLEVGVGGALSVRAGVPPLAPPSISKQKILVAHGYVSKWGSPSVIDANPLFASLLVPGGPVPAPPRAHVAPAAVLGPVAPHAVPAPLQFLVGLRLAPVFALARPPLVAVGVGPGAIVTFCLPARLQSRVFLRASNADILLDQFGIFFRYIHAIAMIPVL
jgi:hypothetical protein